jgi:hypothetical protein
LLASPAGTVHAISRGVLFVKCMELMDRGGFVVVRNRQARVRGANPAAAAGGPVPASVLASPQHAPGAGPQNPFAGGRGAGGGRDGGFGGRGGGRGRGGGSALMGQELKVRCGAYAGYKGRVKQETATHLQVRRRSVACVICCPVCQCKLHSAVHRVGMNVTARGVDDCDDSRIGDAGVALRCWQQHDVLCTAGGILVPSQSLASSATVLPTTLNHMRFCMELQLAAEVGCIDM